MTSWSSHCQILNFSQCFYVTGIKVQMNFIKFLLLTSTTLEWMAVELFLCDGCEVLKKIVSLGVHRLKPRSNFIHVFKRSKNSN